MAKKRRGAAVWGDMADKQRLSNSGDPALPSEYVAWVSLTSVALSLAEAALINHVEFV